VECQRRGHTIVVPRLLRYASSNIRHERSQQRWNSNEDVERAAKLLFSILTLWLSSVQPFRFGGSLTNVVTTRLVQITQKLTRTVGP
jgi:hypothetical protein